MPPGETAFSLNARCYEEALNKLAEVEADVIVSDQRMPGMTGVDFLQRAKELYPDSVRMVLSSPTVAGPTISDSRPVPLRRIRSIWNSRSAAWAKPSAK